MVCSPHLRWGIIALPPIIAAEKKGARPMPHPSRHPTPCGAPLRWRATWAGMARTARAPFFSADVYHRFYLITAAVWLFLWFFNTAHTALYVRLLCRVFIVYVSLNRALSVIKPNKTVLLLRFTCT